MAAILRRRRCRVVVRMLPRAIPLAMIIARQSINGCFLLFYIGMGLCRNSAKEKYYCNYKFKFYRGETN